MVKGGKSVYQHRGGRRSLFLILRYAFVIQIMLGIPYLSVTEIIALGIAQVKAYGGHPFNCKGSTVCSLCLFWFDPGLTILQFHRKIRINGINHLHDGLHIVHLGC